MKYIDIVGKKFGSLLVLSRVKSPDNVINKKSTYFECLCDCGKHTVVIGADLRGGHTKSCGCLQHNKCNEMIGMKFGKLTVLEKSVPPVHLSKKSKKNSFFLCSCDCGKTKIIKAASLRSGRSLSCGCSTDYIDITSKKFGKLFVVEKVETPNHIKDKNRAYFKCVCDCGNNTIVAGKELRSGNRASCGCNIRHDKKEDTKISSARVIYRSSYRDGDLSLDDFLLLSQMKCHYCNSIPSNKANVFKNRKTCTDFSKKHGDFVYNGLDRIDSSFPHNKNNVVPCCKKCNIMKKNYSITEFSEHIKKIYNFFIKG